MKQSCFERDMEEIFQRDVPWEKLDNKTVLVTGAYGMLASYVMFMLFFLNESKNIHINIIAVVRSEEKFIMRFSDARRKYLKIYISQLDEKLEIKEDIDYIIHAASLASPQYYGICPIEVLKPNVIGSYYMLELAAEKKVSGYLLFSTGDIYGVVQDKTQITENDFGKMDTLDIHNCYSESKRMAETMCKAWYQEKNVPVRIARIWHTYSPTMDLQKDPRVFSSFVRDIVNGKNIAMKSEGRAKRSFCYITDAVAAYFKILLEGKSGEAYNVCNTKEFYSIGELAEILVNLYPEMNLKVVRQIRTKSENYVENSVANYIPPDNSKLMGLGWKAEIDVKEGFRRVIDNFRGVSGRVQ